MNTYDVCNESNESDDESAKQKEVNPRNIGSHGSINISRNRKIVNDRRVLDRNDRNLISCDDDSTNTTEVSLLDSSISMTTTAVLSPVFPQNIGTSIQLKKSCGKAKRRREMQNHLEGYASAQRGFERRGESHQDDPNRRQKRRMKIQIERALKFLEHPSISSLSSFEKESYLLSKGLSNDVIKITMETTAMKLPVIPPTNPNCDQNTSDSDSSDTIGSDAYLELSRRNVSYRHTRKDENIIMGGNLLPRVSSLQKTSVNGSHKDKILMKTSNSEEQYHPASLSCDLSRQDEQEQDYQKYNRQPFCLLHDNEYHHDKHHQSYYFIKSQTQPHLPSKLSTEKLIFSPFRSKVIIGAVLTGVVFVMIPLFSLSRNYGLYYIFLRYSSISATTIIEKIFFNNHLQTKVNSENSHLSSNIILDQSGHVDKLDAHKSFPALLPLTVATNPVVDKQLHSGLRSESNKQQDETLRICHIQENTLDATFSAWGLHHNDLDESTKIKEEMCLERSLNKASSRKNDSHYMEGVEECRGDDFGSKTTKEKKIMHKPKIQNEIFPQGTHTFTKSMKNLVSLYGHGSMIPDIQKGKSKLDRVADLGIDEEIVMKRKYHHVEKTKHSQVELRTFSDLLILAHFTQLKSTMDSLKSEVIKKSCYNGVYNEEIEEHSHWKCVGDGNIFRLYSGKDNVMEKFDEISTSLKVIESKLMSTAGKKDSLKIGLNNRHSDSVLYLRKEILFGQHEMHHNKVTEYFTTMQHNDRQSDILTNPGDKVMRAYPDWIPKLFITTFFKKTLQILGHIFSKIRLGFRLITKIGTKKTPSDG